jgi:hypothetical protein
MADVVEIVQGQTFEAAEALLLLRPRWTTTAAVTDFVDTQLRPMGYRLVGAFERPGERAASVVGFRELWSTAWGHYM